MVALRTYSFRPTSRAQRGVGHGGRREGAQGLTQHVELQLPGVCASATGGLAVVQPSVRCLDSSKVDRAPGSLTRQGHAILEPVQLRFGVTLSHTVQIKGFSSQYLQDPRARLHLRGNWQGPRDEHQGGLSSYGSQSPSPCYNPDMSKQQNHHGEGSLRQLLLIAKKSSQGPGGAESIFHRDT